MKIGYCLQLCNCFCLRVGFRSPRTPGWMLSAFGISAYWSVTFHSRGMSLQNQFVTFFSGLPMARRGETTLQHLQLQTVANRPIRTQKQAEWEITAPAICWWQVTCWHRHSIPAARCTRWHRHFQVPLMLQRLWYRAAAALLWWHTLLPHIRLLPRPFPLQRFQTHEVQRTAAPLGAGTTPISSDLRRFPCAAICTVVHSGWPTHIAPLFQHLNYQRPVWKLWSL